MHAYTRIFFLLSSRKLLHAYFNKQLGKPIRIKMKDLDFIAVFDMIFIYRGPRYLIWRTYSKYTIYMYEKQISNENEI